MWWHLVLHFQVLHFQVFHLFWFPIFRSCIFSRPILAASFFKYCAEKQTDRKRNAGESPIHATSVEVGNNGIRKTRSDCIRPKGNVVYFTASIKLQIWRAEKRVITFIKSVLCVELGTSFLTLSGWSSMLNTWLGSYRMRTISLPAAANTVTVPEHSYELAVYT